MSHRVGECGVQHYSTFYDNNLVFLTYYRLLTVMKGTLVCVEKRE